MKFKVVLVVPYFGKFPNYFQLFLESCRFNPEFQWLIFTDDHTEFNYPSNVRVIYMTFKDIQERIQSKFNFKISMERAYKICDFRPEYGVIFEDELRELKCDFWGHCDIDLLFGNLSKYVTDTLLETYDKVFYKGHFSLYRNTEYMNHLFMSPINGKEYWKTVFSSVDSLGFDENGIDENIGMYTIFKNKQINLYEEPVYASLDVTKAHFQLSVYPYDNREEKRNKCSIFIWEKGEIQRYCIRDGALIKTEYMYLHLQSHPVKNNYSWNERPDAYMIAPNFISEKPHYIDKKLLRKYGYRRLLYVYFWKKRILRILKKIRKMR